MNKLLITITSTLMLISILLTGLIFNLKNPPELALGGAGGISAKSCDSLTSTSVVVGPGNEGRVRIVGTSTRRAISRISLSNSGTNIPATSTVSLAFDNDSRATVGTGFTLATDTPYIDFGINTDFPYSGSVQGITSGGSTTVKLIQCNY